MADITYIPIRQLHPHPDNPRKEPVSYTHLDVYKRQCLDRVLSPG